MTGEKEEAAAKGGYADLLRKAGEALVPLVVSGASFVGFVAFAGAVIEWTRLTTVEVPPEQAIAAFPRGELVAIGAAVLLIFGFFGALATIATYMTDRGGRATPGMARTLLLILVLEAIGAIVLAPNAGEGETVIASAIFVAAAAIVLRMTFAVPFVKVKDVLYGRSSKARPPKRSAGVLLPRRGVGFVTSTALFILAAFLFGLLSWDHGIPLGVLIVLAVPAIAAARCDVKTYDRWRVKVEAAEERAARKARARSDDEPVRSGPLYRLAGLLPFVRGWREAEVEAREKREADDAEEREEDRLERTRPYRLIVTRGGALAMSAPMVAAIVLPAIVVNQAWLAGALAAASLICAGLWRVAMLSKAKFVWFGLAVFISVPLFGTFALVGRNLVEPQVQPIALIRSSDGPDESLQGIYVTESDDRVYFANLATEGCSKRLSPNSGRLLWVSKDDVVAMSIGPSQDVESAARSALEMSNALTRSVETPTGKQVELGGAKEPAKAPPVAEGDGKTRLGSAGPAVRPYFGRGLRLDPEQAAPGTEVTLRMTAPNLGDGEGRDGFGRWREGKTLRLGGVEAKIAKEEARNAAGAEFARLADGRDLILEKRTLYTRAPDEEIVKVGDGQRVEGESRFVKLDDRSVRRLIGGKGPDDMYLAVGAGGRLVGRPSVTLDGGGNAVDLQPQLWRQAWHPNYIRFVVPEDAGEGEVTVECKQLAGQPVLRVVRASTARITVRMQGGSPRVVFDSGHSGDEGGEVTSRQWTVAGRPAGSQDKVSPDLPPRFGAYSVRLQVTNADGESDSTKAKLLRLPASLFKFGRSLPVKQAAVDHARKIVRAAIEEADAPPVAIEIHGHADEVGTDAYNVGLSLRRARWLRKELFSGSSSELTGEQSKPGDLIPMTIRAFGETCPIDRRPGPRKANRRVEIFILEPGVAVATPKSCSAASIKQSRW